MAAADRPAVLPGPGRTAPPAARRPPPAPAPPPSDPAAAAQSAAAAGAGGGGFPRPSAVGPSLAGTARAPARSPAAPTEQGVLTHSKHVCGWRAGATPPTAPAAAHSQRSSTPRPFLTDEEDEASRGKAIDPQPQNSVVEVQESGVPSRGPCLEARRSPTASMPWDARRPGGGADGGPEGSGAALSRAQKQCRKSSFAFYQAVRDLLPVWLLEDMRASEAFHWDERGRAAAYSPSEALLYALVHDHQAYAHYLLATFPRRALLPPSACFRCCAAPGPHVALAVRYNRVGILRCILRTVRDFPAEERARLLDRRGCSRVEGGGTSLHVACELARPECLFLLLGHGASPGLRDSGGLTPLELLLRQLGRDAGATPPGTSAATGNPAAAPGEPRQRRLLLLDLLALYTPAGVASPARHELLGDRQRWQRLLGEDKFQWLAGLAPPSLFARAMQVLVTAISPGRFPEALDELPLPPFLQPLDLTGKG